MAPATIAIHGGAGTILRSAMTPEKETAYRAGLEAALSAGFRILERGGSALDAVEAAVRVMEDDELFNAGRGSVFDSAGRHGMDATIMEGAKRAAGCVCLVEGVKNPITLARHIMEHTKHVHLGGEAAEEYAKSVELDTRDPTYFFSHYRYDQWLKARSQDEVSLDHSEKEELKSGTVGAVAVDANGHVAAATSSGGMTNKLRGRVGDSAEVGAGTYADDRSCAVSCTGHGEFFQRGCVAVDVSCRMLYGGRSLQEAAQEAIHDTLKNVGGSGGLVAVDALGHVAMPLNSLGMYRAMRSTDGRFEVSIYKDEQKNDECN